MNAATKTMVDDKPITAPSRTVEIGPLRADETREVAQLHLDFFGEGEGQGYSLAMLGVDFLEEAFYRPNLDNPYFFVDVARYNGEIIAFSVFATNHSRVFRHTMRKHFGSLSLAVLKCFFRQPFKTASNVIGNLPFITESLPAETRKIPAWFILLGVKQPYRSREFQERAGVWIAGEFKQRLEHVLREHGCKEYWAAPFADNAQANQFYKKINAQLFAQGPVQGVMANYYRMSIS